MKKKGSGKEKLMIIAEKKHSQVFMLNQDFEEEKKIPSYISPSGLHFVYCGGVSVLPMRREHATVYKGSYQKGWSLFFIPFFFLLCVAGTLNQTRSEKKTPCGIFSSYGGFY